MLLTEDVAIVGAGVMGCGIALRLAQAGARVTVLERAVPGAEASSAAAGILAAQEEADAPGPLFELGLRSRALLRALADELRAATGVDVGYRPAGVMRACFTSEEEAAAEARYGWQRAAGLRLVWLRGAELTAAEPGIASRVVAALHFPDDAQIDPRAYMRALSLAAAAAGARFRTGGYVRRILEQGGRAVGVDVDGDTIPAGAVVVAAGSWSSLVEGAGLAARAVRPMRGQIVELETRPPAVRGVITGPGGYVVGRADGRVLCGSTMELAGFDKKVTAGGLRHVLDTALALVPGLADAPVQGSWANFRPFTDDKLPVLGETPVRGLFLATGHFRNGILLSAVTAEILCDAVLGRPATIDLGPFAPARLY